MGFFDAPVWLRVVLSIFAFSVAILFSWGFVMVGSCSPFWPVFVVLASLLILVYASVPSIMRRDFLGMFLTIGLIVIVLIFLISYVGNVVSCNNSPTKGSGASCESLMGKCLEICQDPYIIPNPAFDDTCENGLRCCMSLGAS